MTSDKWYLVESGYVMFINIYIYGTGPGPCGPAPPPPWWGTFGSMRRGRFFHHKIHIKHQDLAQKDGRYNMVMLITREMDE